MQIVTGWWFGTWLVFFIGNNHPNWRSYFSEGFKPTNQVRFGTISCFNMFQRIGGKCCSKTHIFYGWFPAGDFPLKQSIDPLIVCGDHLFRLHYLMAAIKFRPRSWDVAFSLSHVTEHMFILNGWLSFSWSNQNFGMKCGFSSIQSCFVKWSVCFSENHHGSAIRWYVSYPVGPPATKVTLQDGDFTKSVCHGLVTLRLCPRGVFSSSEHAERIWVHRRYMSVLLPTIILIATLSLAFLSSMIWCSSYSSKLLSGDLSLLLPIISLRHASFILHFTQFLPYVPCVGCLPFGNQTWLAEKSTLLASGWENHPSMVDFPAKHVWCFWRVSHQMSSIVIARKPRLNIHHLSMMFPARNLHLPCGNLTQLFWGVPWPLCLPFL